MQLYPASVSSNVIPKCERVYEPLTGRWKQQIKTHVIARSVYKTFEARASKEKEIASDYETVVFLATLNNTRNFKFYNANYKHSSFSLLQRISWKQCVDSNKPSFSRKAKRVERISHSSNGIFNFLPPPRWKILSRVNASRVPGRVRRSKRNETKRNETRRAHKREGL